MINGFVTTLEYLWMFPRCWCIDRFISKEACGKNNLLVTQEQIMFLCRYFKKKNYDVFVT